MKITFSQAVEGFNLAKRAEQLSHHTLRDYNTSFRKFRAYLNGADPTLDEITPDQVRSFLDYLGTTPIAPAGIAPRPAKPLSAKTLLNIHTGLSALWTWAVREDFVAENIIHRVARPRPESRAIEPLSREDVDLLLAACDFSRIYKRPGRRACKNRRLTAQRDRLIISFLLDTGVRIGELCALCVKDIDLRNSRVKIMGKGARERIVPMGKSLSKKVWKWLATRPDAQPEEPFVTTLAGEELTRSGIGHVLRRLGNKAGVRNVHPHRFRHTFAINYLRNSGRELALMRILGHSTMEMTRRYARIAQADIERDHRIASPLDAWKL